MRSDGEEKAETREWLRGVAFCEKLTVFYFLQLSYEMSIIMVRLKITGRYIASVLLLLAVVQTSESENAHLKMLKQLSLNPKEISRILKREIISKKLVINDKRDIAVLGAMVLDVPAEATVVAARDIKTFKQGKEILALGKFDRFEPEEIKAFTLDDKELVSLGNCRIHDCDTKMPGPWIETLNREKDKKTRLQMLRVLLADYAKDYASRGNKAVLDYENTKHPVKAQREFVSVLENSSYLKILAPEFHHYLKEYPDVQLSGTENFIYWSREKFGFKPVTNLTHVSIYRWSQSELNGYMIASRQIFADHYYDASLGLTILIDRPPQDGKSPGSYLIYINRSRIDMLGGFLSSLRRAITLPRIRKGLESHMKIMRLRVEDKTEKQSRQL